MPNPTLGHPKPRGLVFDLDGTLIDSREDIAHACNHALEDAGRERIPVSEIKTYVGDGAKMLLARAFRTSESDPILEAALASYNTYYRAHPIAHTRFLPGAREALLRLTHYPMAVATNKSMASTTIVLDALGITDTFVHVVGSGDGPLKPHPYAVERCAKAMNLPTSDIWMIGDGPQDVGAGRAAGAVTVGVLGGFHHERLLDAKPDLLFDTMVHMVEALLRA